MGKQFKKNVGAIVERAGVSFRVWAPFAQQVSVAGSFSNWTEVPMANENDGYWWAFVKAAVAGQEYKFCIRNGENIYWRNDPRAMHFITSAGNSVIVDKQFDWGNDEYMLPPREQQVIYELHVGTFNRPDAATTGTFINLIEKLDYLAELGVNTIELMPIGSMMMDRGWGYAIDYIFAVESLYGGRYGFLQFVKAAHNKGIGVVLDVVYNHFGPDNNLDLWQFDGWQQDGKGGIYFYNDWRAETPWGNTRPDFGRKEVQQYILDNVKMWMHECHVDGLRVDSTIFIRNVKGYNNDPANDIPEGWYMMQQINSVAKKIKPTAITIAEDIGANDYLVKPASASGAGFSAQWELGFSYALRQALHSNDVSQIDISGITQQLCRNYNGDPFQRIVYTDSHDSAANGSARLNEVISPGNADSLFARRQLLIAAVLTFTAPGVPMLFQGQEFMEEGAFNDWRGLDWSKAERFNGIVLAYKHLIGLRKNQTKVSAGLTGTNINLLHVDEANKVIAYHRWKSGGAGDDTVVLINFSGKEYSDYEIAFPGEGNWRVRFNNNWPGYSSDFKSKVAESITVDIGKAKLTLEPSSAIIYSQDK